MILFINHTENYNHEFLTLQSHFNVVSIEMRIIFTVCIENSMTAVDGMCQRYTVNFLRADFRVYCDTLFSIEVRNLDIFSVY